MYICEMSITNKIKKKYCKFAFSCLTHTYWSTLVNQNTNNFILIYDMCVFWLISLPLTSKITYYHSQDTFSKKVSERKQMRFFPKLWQTRIVTSAQKWHLPYHYNVNRRVVVKLTPKYLNFDDQICLLTLKIVDN